ncbi:methyl-accepting chemotaxis protein [Peribacillus deserti]|uniref:Methyl-accepting chemotaxis protein n=1 Tax=Peribacillus deserti TaxID=673318 RepID=A0A2N5MBE5_9BACI|nr:HAMP domain-containing methyl-accepting chemotaxis protein [Peribacillus deserti]PLT31689.1 methyl-accepting chemotaxis protein [Peribacillus deserti]
MAGKKRYKFGLRKKLVIFTTLLAIITYSTSALFIYGIYPFVSNYLNEGLFNIIILLLGIAWSGILAFFAAGFLTKPLQRLEQAALKAASGDLSEDLKLSKSDDEIRSLGEAFNNMLYNLRDMVQKIDQNFKETNDKVIYISQESSRAAEQAETISRAIREISLGADNSAASIQTTAESVEEVITLARDVQDKANSSSEKSSEMVQELVQSKQVIHSLISGIQQLADDSIQSLDAVKRLEENAKKVEQIIQLVGDIAGQTNLLALNASIEAARAGEHGKGFAVVAEEVRKLADESAKAVQGISSLIQNIQQDVQGVVKQITEQVESAKTEANKGTKTNEVIEEMTVSVNNVAEAVRDITKLVDQQMESIKETSAQSQEVAAIAQETSAGAVQVASATEDQARVITNVEGLASELRQQAEQLKETITRFQM